jgi:uncharacterized membrane protein (DUF4010 family)
LPRSVPDAPSAGAGARRRRRDRGYLRRDLHRARARVEDREARRAFSIKAALALVTTMAAMLVAAATLKQSLGDTGMTIGAAAAGLVDTHSAAISVASLAARSKQKRLC